MTTTSFTDAITAYRAAARSAMGITSGESAQTDTNAVGAPGTAFADMVKDTVKGAVDASQKAEKISMKAIAGQADLRDVVTAVANAEVTLETVVAIRDKVVNAYTEVLKMPL